MAKINTTNYQPVTAWNGTQDLLIVEQPDGTKVATPEQVKQYVEAGDFEATGEVKDGHGNILDDLAGQISQLDDELDEKTQNTLKYIELDAGVPDVSVIRRGGIVYHATYMSIHKGRIGLGLCFDEGNTNNYLIALLYRAERSDTVKYVEISKNGLYISATNNQGTAAIEGNTGTRQCYTITFY